MKPIALVFTIILFLVLLMPVLAEENQTDLCAGVVCSPVIMECPDGSEISCTPSCSPDTGQCGECVMECPDSCAGVTCPASTATCPDGYVSTCPNTCDPATGECSHCEPDCTGHEIVVGGECAGVDCGISKTICPDGFEVSCINPCEPEIGCGQCIPDCTGHETPAECIGEGEPYSPVESRQCCAGLKSISTQVGDGRTCSLTAGYVCSPCGNGECEAYESACSCPEDCPCPEGMRYSHTCPDGTEVPWCECSNGQWVCMISSESGCPPPVCGDGICEISEEETCLEDCAPEPCVCSLLFNPVCGVDGATYPNRCQAACAGIEIACSGRCPCATEPVPIPKPQPSCPVEDVCPDGVTRPCELINNECICKPCPLPPECREEVSPQGFIHVICEEPVTPECPPIPEGWERRCVEEGGKPVRWTGPAPGNCLFIDCVFDDIPTLPITPIECPPPEEVDRKLAKCAEMGQKGVVVYEGGCKLAKCIQPESLVCPPITYGVEEEELKEKCFENGLEVVRDFDSMGCPYLRCGEPGKLREIPKEAREKCIEMGGEFIEKRDEFGYIVFHECVMPGEDEIRVEPIERVPDMTQLLEIAFSLENLKIELNELGRKTDDIANYYARTGSPEAERFRRAADMFYSAKSKVDEIKAKLKERLESITISDLMDIKHDVIYIKDVILKDILYLMLSTGEDVQKVVSGDETDCGTDGECFDRAFRTCKKITFRPEGESGLIVKIKGLDGDFCMLHAILPEEEGPLPGMIPGVYPPYEMICRIPDYSLGVGDPEQGIFPYCDGSLVAVMKQMSETPEQVSGPGGCTSDIECKEYCSRAENSQECMEFTQKKGFEQKQCSGCLDNGICDPGECPGCADCPTEEEKDFESAFRECREGTVLPPNGGPIVKIHGVEGDLCVMDIIVEENEPYPPGEVTISPEEWNPPYNMICRIPDYYLGSEPVEERLLPYCEGSLLGIIKIERKVVQSVTDCGMDGGCFDTAFRECRLAIFRPGGSDSVVKIKGLEGDRCILTQVVEEGVPCCPEGISPEDWNPPYEMVCKVPDYQMGINPPEENVLPYCEGSLVEIIYAAGPQPV